MGTAAFTAAGQIRMALVGTQTILSMNTDGNTGTIEMQLALNGNFTTTNLLAATDFIL